MKIQRAELNKIQEILNKFPDVNGFELVYHGGGGIGYTLSMKFNYKINDIDTIVEVEVTGVENW